MRTPSLEFSLPGSEDILGRASGFDSVKGRTVCRNEKIPRFTLTLVEPTADGSCTPDVSLVVLLRTTYVDTRQFTRALPPARPEGHETRTKGRCAACCNASEHGDFSGILERTKRVCVRRWSEPGLRPPHPKGAFPETCFVLAD